MPGTGSPDGASRSSVSSTVSPGPRVIPPRIHRHVPGHVPARSRRKEAGLFARGAELLVFSPSEGVARASLKALAARCSLALRGVERSEQASCTRKYEGLEIGRTN